MGNQSKGNNGGRPNRTKVGKGETPSNLAQGGSDQDGSNGTDRPVEPVAEKSAGQEGEETEELQLKKAGQFRDFALALFMTKAKKKYDKGQTEHGGFLPRDVQFLDMEDEIIDMWFYYQAMKAKVYGLAPENVRDHLFGKRKAVKSDDMESNNPGA